MRNHNEKTRDMVESVLPSTARLEARRRRRLAHASERVRVRAALHRALADGDYDDPLVTFDNHHEVVDAMWGRRGADKLGSFLHWAERTIATDPVLRASSAEDQLNYFRRKLPDNTIGRHALSHLRWVLVDPWVPRDRTPTRPRRLIEIEGCLEVIVAAGAVGELNSRIREELGGWDPQRVVPIPAPTTPRPSPATSTAAGSSTSSARSPASSDHPV